LMRLVKLLKLDRVLDHIELQIGPAWTAMLIYWMQLLQWLITVFFVCHWNACIWWIVGKPGGLLGSDSEEDGEKHWTTEWRRDLGQAEVYFRWLDRPERQQYLFCLYWTLGVMRTMPSEVHPVNAAERTYTIIYMFVACSIFAVCITKVTTMFNKISEKRSALSEGLATLKSYMHSYKIDTTLQHRCVDYLEALFAAKRLRSNEQRYLDELSSGLKAEVHVATHGPVITSHWVFAWIDPELVGQIVLRSTVVLMAEDEMVTEAGSEAARGFFRVRGELQALFYLAFQDAGTKPCVSIPRRIDWVDVECLCTVEDILSPLTVKTKEFCELVVVARETMRTLFKDHPDLTEQMGRIFQVGPSRSTATARKSAQELTNRVRRSAFVHTAARTSLLGETGGMMMTRQGSQLDLGENPFEASADAAAAAINCAG